MSNRLDLNDMPSYTASHVNPSCLHLWKFGDAYTKKGDAYTKKVQSSSLHIWSATL